MAPLGGRGKDHHRPVQVIRMVDCSRQFLVLFIFGALLLIKTLGHGDRLSNHSKAHVAGLLVAGVGT